MTLRHSVGNVEKLSPTGASLGWLTQRNGPVRVVVTHGRVVSGAVHASVTASMIADMERPSLFVHVTFRRSADARYGTRPKTSDIGSHDEHTRSSAT
eukprot:2657696-Prymnesium_polylepis.1